MPLFTKTLNAAATTGYLFDVSAGGGVGRIDIYSKVEAYVRPTSDTTVVAPVATPAPAAGAQANYIHLAANERVVVDLNQGILAPEVPVRSPDKIKKIQVWAVGAGDILLVGN